MALQVPEPFRAHDHDLEDFELEAELERYAPLRAMFWRWYALLMVAAAAGVFVLLVDA